MAHGRLITVKQSGAYLTVVAGALVPAESGACLVCAFAQAFGVKGAECQSTNELCTAWWNKGSPKSQEVGMGNQQTPSSMWGARSQP